MISGEDRAKWRLRIESAAERYKDAQLRVYETAIERLTLPVPDGNFDHSKALREETMALRNYRDLLVEYSRILMSETDEH